MGLAIDLGQPTGADMLRIIGEEISNGIRLAETDKVDLETRVHDIRTGCKKVRGTLRLIEDSLPKDVSLKAEDKRFAGIARLLATHRDSDVMVKTFDATLEARIPRKKQDHFTPLRDRLASRASSHNGTGGSVHQALEQAGAALKSAHQQVGGWKIRHSGFGVIAGGLEGNYRKARKQMAKARNSDCPEDLHDWRKFAKYHMYHLRIIESIWDPVLKPLRRETAALAEDLGFDHDLEVLRDHLLNETGSNGAAVLAEEFADRIAELQSETRKRIFARGAKIFAEKPARFRDRIGAYWETAVESEA